MEPTVDDSGIFESGLHVQIHTAQEVEDNVVQEILEQENKNEKEQLTRDLEAIEQSYPHTSYGNDEEEYEKKKSAIVKRLAALDNPEKEIESEEMRLVRTGEMTPFGSLTQPHQPASTMPAPGSFEHYLLEQDKKNIGRKVSAKGHSVKTAMDVEVVSNSSFSQAMADDDEMTSTQLEKAKNMLSPHRLITSPKQFDSEDKSPIKLKLNEISRHADDGNRKLYHLRMREFEEFEHDKEAEIRESGESEPTEEGYFEGGLRVPARIWHRLYRYQQTGVRWLWELHLHSCGGVVGDQMGLGKSIQLIAFLAALRYSKSRDPATRYIGLGPVLIVSPATIMSQWVSEFHIWWPPLRVAILHSSGSSKTSVRSLVRSICEDRGVLVTSYGTLLSHIDYLVTCSWHYIVLDEGHKIRNPDSQITVGCKRFSTPHRLILSGSPIQNNLKELWSIFDFVFPGKLGTLADFMQYFAVPIQQGGFANATEVQVQTAYKCACVLKDTINPYLLRRMKEDVKLQLPSKNEQVLFCDLTDIQKEVYKEYLESKECEAILAGQYKVFAGLITLRKICNHPDLVTGGVREFYGDTQVKPDQGVFGHIKRSGKMIVLKTLLKIWKGQEHRVLLFTQSRQMLNVLEHFAKDEEFSYMRMDGATAIGNRKRMVDLFNKDRSIFLFILTTRVGGLGVNLIGADRVVIFDPDWNPSTDLQARERAWRIGQTRQVTIYRLLTAGTIEEKIYHRQIFKQFMTNRILKDARQRRFFKSNDLFELFTLGSREKSDATETSAIFAGTGSDVSVKPKRKNRFDAMLDKKLPLEENEGLESDDELSDLMQSTKEERMRQLAKQISKIIGNKSDDPLPQLASTLSKAKAKKKKRKTKANFEGHTVDFLKAQQPYNPGDQEDLAHLQDNYVLRKLFNKSVGVHSALQHDTIMESADPDFALVEGEANRVAKEAAEALRRSREKCRRVRDSSELMAPPPEKKRRFGSKQNTATASNHTEAPSSSELLAVMRKRNLKTVTQQLRDEAVRSEELGLPDNASTSDDVITVEQIDSDLAEDLRNFIAFGAAVDGRASTRELLDTFGSRLPPSDSAKFKAMLKELCEFRKMDGLGVWELKPEFR